MCEQILNIPINIFNDYYTYDKKIDIEGFTLKLEFTKNLILYNNNESKYHVFNLIENNESNDLEYKFIPGYNKIENNKHGILQYKCEINGHIINIDKSTFVLNYTNNKKNNPIYICDKNKIFDRVEKIKKEIDRIKNIQDVIIDILNNETTINYKKDHVMKNIDFGRFKKKDRKRFGLTLYNVIENNEHDLNYYYDIMIKNEKFKFIENYKKKIEDHKEKIYNKTKRKTIRKLEKNSKYNDCLNEYKNKIFIVYMYYIILKQCVSYEQILNIAHDNITKNNYYSDDILFHDIIENIIKCVNDNDYVNYGIFDNNLYSKIYYFKTQNIYAVARNENNYKIATGILLAKSKQDEKWNIFPCATNNDDDIKYDNIVKLCDEFKKIQVDTKINFFTKN